MKTKKMIREYISNWKLKDYEQGIPDEVPNLVMDGRLAPSWKAIAVCLLKNDMHLTGLGFAGFHSEYYDAIKRDEISRRPGSGRVMIQTRLRLQQSALVAGAE